MFLFLLKELNCSDRDFIKDIFIKFYPLMLKRASCLVGSDSADNILMEAMVRLMKYVDTLKSIEEHARISYIMIVVRNAAYDFLKSQGKIKEHELHLSENDLSKAVHDQAFELVEVKTAVQLVIQLLKPRDQDLLYCRYYLQLSYKEISRFMNIPQKHVGTYISNARRYALDILHKGGWA